MKSNTHIRYFAIITLLHLVCVAALQAEIVSIGDRTFTIPDGFELTAAVAPELSQRPIVVDFDDEGNLYVAESSGTNDNVQKQLEEKPHSILKLSDSDGDGVFDHKTVFADRMMFPEGALWHAGSLYVSAPPQIWKLTDQDGDGIADQREVWFDAKTLTGCANDLHGPYLGPDGWIYWCKGAFAEQAYERVDRSPFVTRAAHIFRRRPDGGPIEPVMTGGMDNPVEVAFSKTGERFFTTTFFQHPANGQRDGLVHAIYGGVYGKRHGVLDGHPRTGKLMPVMAHLGAAAPSGLARLESNALGFQDQLVSACFNLHSVQLHRLVSAGSTFSTRDTDLVVSDDVDFHPTDVIEDADGSLLIVDTGGWYKLCCPTSQLHKPDVLGSIYRLRKKDWPTQADPRGSRIDWRSLDVAADATRIVPLLSDPRFAVRRQIIAYLSQRGASSLPVLSAALRQPDRDMRRNAVWCLCRMDDARARELVRLALRDDDHTVRHAAAHAVSVWRDRQALPELERLLRDKTMSVRRVAAEALGRTGNSGTVKHLLSALAESPDRVLEHSLIYALIEIGSPEEVKQGLESGRQDVVRAALQAIGAMENVQLTQAEVCRFLAIEGDDDSEIRHIVTRIAAQNLQWGDRYAEVLKSRPWNAATAEQAGALTGSPSVQMLTRDWLLSEAAPPEFRVALLQHLNLNDFGEEWPALAASLLEVPTAAVASAAVQKLALQESDLSDILQLKLRLIAQSNDVDATTRLTAMQCVGTVDDPTFRFAKMLLTDGNSVQHRSRAAVTLSQLQLTNSQLEALADAHRSIGPLELARMMTVFESRTETQLGLRLFAALAENPVAEALPVDQLAKLAAQFGNEVVALAQPLLAKADITPAEMAGHLDDLLARLPSGDIQKGHHVFHSKTAACFSCHALGYRGGRIGPDLSRIARIRSRRDLLEAIVYPSASFVRSYEPISILTKDGNQVMGIVRDQTDQEVVVQSNATETKTISTGEIDSMLPSRVSIMPAGLEKQLSLQQLADLLAFLESRK